MTLILRFIILISLTFSPVCHAGFWDSISKLLLHVTQKYTTTKIIATTLITGIIVYTTHKFFFGFKKNHQELKDLKDHSDDLTTQVISLAHNVHIHHSPAITPEQFLQKTQSSIQAIEKKLNNIGSANKNQQFALQKELTHVIREIDSFVIRSNTELEFIKQLSRLYSIFLGNDAIDIQAIYKKLGFDNNLLGIQASFEEVVRRITHLKSSPVSEKIQRIFSDAIAKDNFDAMIQGSDAVKKLLSISFSSTTFINLIVLKRKCSNLIQGIENP